MTFKTENYDMFLLAVVSLISLSVAGAAELAAPTAAAHPAPTRIASDAQIAPVRVIVPFTPNVSPGQR